MVIARRFEHLGDDLVVVKQARTDGDVARLTHEARMLLRCQHPGVVELVEVEDRAIRLRFAGSALSRVGPLPLDQVAAVVSVIADVVDAVHRCGVAHANIDAEHVLIDDRGRPHLCGFGHAVEAGETAMAGDVAALGQLLKDQLRRGEDLVWTPPGSGFRVRAARRQARRDLDALAETACRTDTSSRPSARQFAKAVHAAVPTAALPAPAAGRALAPSAPADVAPLPEEVDPTQDLRWTSDDLSFLAHQHEMERDVFDNAEFGRGTFTSSVFDGETDSDPYAELRDIAGGPDLEASAGEGSEPTTFWARRPGPATAEELSGLPEPSAPAGPVEEPVRARIEVDFDPSSRPSEDTGALPPTVLPPSRTDDDTPEPDATRTVTPLVLAGLAAAAVLALGAVVGAAVTSRLRPVDDAAATSTTSTTAAGVPPTWPAGCDVPVPAGPDVSGDGCPEPIEAVGRQITLGSVTVEVGVDGDQVAFGDWSCDGIATPALLRPSTGEVFVFPTWSLEDEIVIEATARVEGATSIRASADACPHPIVTGPDGDTAIPAR